MSDLEQALKTLHSCQKDLAIAQALNAELVTALDQIADVANQALKPGEANDHPFIGFALVEAIAHTTLAKARASS